MQDTFARACDDRVTCIQILGLKHTRPISTRAIRVCCACRPTLLGFLQFCSNKYTLARNLTYFLICLSHISKTALTVTFQIPGRHFSFSIFLTARPIARASKYMLHTVTYLHTMSLLHVAYSFAHAKRAFRPTAR